MGGFRRFLLFVVSLAGIACAVVPLVAMAPRATDFASMVETLASYRGAELGYLVCALVTLTWCAANLIRAIFSRRDSAISVMSVGGGTITVARSAVASQASHIVEALGVGTASSVDVRCGAHGPVRVRVRVTPYESIDVTSEAPVLHEGLVAGLTAMCGERLGAVDVEFLEPVRPSSLVEAVEDAGGQASAAGGAAGGEVVAADMAGGSGVPGEAVALDAPAAEAGATGAPDPGTAPDSAAAPDSGEIVIPMRSERGGQHVR